MKKNIFFEQKQGDPERLSGHVTVYAKITNIESADNQKSPVYDMAKNGLLASTGDYRTQHSLEDFLKKELGITLEELGNSENISITGLPNNVDPDFIKKKIESMKGFEDLIPTPAKLAIFDSEEEILSRPGDIFYLGEFERLANANLAINAFPILYQALYREQVARLISQEIDKMLTSAVKEVAETDHYLNDIDGLEKKILTEYLPELIYNKNNKEEQGKWINRFKAFMGGYKYSAEIDTIIELATTKDSEKKRIQTLIELYVKKIAAFLKEDYKTVGALKKEIEEFRLRKS
jgi:hypothetical protein